MSKQHPLIDKTKLELHSINGADYIRVDELEKYLEGRRRRLRIGGFTKTERQVIELLKQGLSTKEIASKLFIEPKSVKWHITNIYKAAKVSSRAEFLVKAFTQTKVVNDSYGPK